jgi:hypothetical protein
MIKTQNSKLKITCNTMAATKSKTTTTSSVKITKTKSTGKAKKHFGPKEEKPKKYKGQGR